MNLRKAIRDEIKKHIDTDAITDAVHGVMMAKIAETVGGASAEAPKPRRTRAQKATAKKRTSKAASGEKRDPAAIEAVMNQIERLLKKEDGQGVEAIGSALELSTVEMRLPIRKLIAEKRVKAKGQKRATKYFVATPRASKGANGAAEKAAE